MRKQTALVLGALTLTASVGGLYCIGRSIKPSESLLEPTKGISEKMGYGIAPSPACNVLDNSTDGGSYHPARPNGINVSPGDSVTVELASTSGVRSWSLSVFGLDDQTNASPPALTFAAGPPNSYTFTFPNAVGRAVLLQSVVNGGVDINGTQQPSYTTTIGIFTQTSEGFRVLANGETIETNPVGWVADVNNPIRNTVDGGVYVSSGTGYATGANGSLNSSLQGGNVGQVMALCDGGSGQPAVACAQDAGPTAAIGADVFGPYNGDVLVLQITGDGGTNPFGGTGTVPILAHATILAYGSTHPVYGGSKAGTTTNGAQTTICSYTPPKSSLDKWTLSIEGLLIGDAGVVAADAGLADYYEADYTFVDTVAVDGGTAFNPPSPLGGDGGVGTSPVNGTNVSRGSCSGTGCGWFTIVSFSAGTINGIAVGGATQTVNWNCALQLQEQH